MTPLELAVGIGLILSVPIALWLIWRAGRQSWAPRRARAQQLRAARRQKRASAG